VIEPPTLQVDKLALTSITAPKSGQTTTNRADPTNEH
jgi:hypothetical protein